MKEFEGKVAVLLGAENALATLISNELKQKGAEVLMLARENYRATEQDLTGFADEVIGAYGKIDFLLPITMLTRGGIEDCSYADFQYELQNALLTPYYLTKLFQNHIRREGKILMIYSAADLSRQPSAESLATVKGGVEQLVGALSASFHAKVSVNSLFYRWDTAANSNKLQAVADYIVSFCKNRNPVSGKSLMMEEICSSDIYHDESGWKVNEYHWK